MVADLFHHSHSFFKKYRFPLSYSLCFFLLGLVLFFSNYVPGTYLMGWDNIMPELNIKENFIRSLVSVWQEYRGVGLYDGMSHAANLIQTVFIALLNSVFPQNAVRYIAIIFYYCLGGLGATLVSRYLLSLLYPQSELHTKRFIVLPLLIGLIYMFNIGTLQMIVVPLESFILHFAALPYVLLSSLLLLNELTRRTVFFFALVVLLASTQYFVPTLIMASTLLISVVSGVFLLTSLFKRQFLSVLTRVCIMGILYLCLNAYWLIPWAAGLPQNAPVIASAKINQMSSSEVFSQNQAYGDITGVLLLRGWVFDQTELNNEGEPAFLLDTWRDISNSWVGTLFAWTMVSISMLGLLSTFVFWKRKHVCIRTTLLSISLLYVSGILLMGTNIPYIREIQEYIRTTFPFVAEAYRFPFTKFILLYAFIYAIQILLGILVLFHILKHKVVQIIIITFIIGYVGLHIFPAVQGRLFFSSMRVSLPSEYQSLLETIKQESHTTRIAILPQTEYWSWKYYSYGYRGSGFLWFGASQPVLDRAFDPWSHTNEQYYWQLNHAIYSKNPQLIKSVFDNYSVGLVIFDGYQLAAAGNNKSLLEDQTKSMLEQIDGMELIRQFGRLTLWRYTNNSAKTFVRSIGDVPSVSPSERWFDYDQANVDYRIYKQPISSNFSTAVYPFRSLFSKRSVEEQPFVIYEDDATFVVQTQSLPFIDESIPPKYATTSGIVRAGNSLEYILEKNPSHRFTADTSNYLIPSLLSSCGFNDSTEISGHTKAGFGSEWLSIQTTNGSACLKFGYSELSHRVGYLVKVVSRFNSGKPLAFTIIDDTSKQNAIDTYLSLEPGWNTSYFFLPARADDGLGYSFIISNKAIGTEITANDIRSIEFYEFPYEELQQLTFTDTQTFTSFTSSVQDVYHPHPAYYKVSVNSSAFKNLILYQAFDKGWKGYMIDSCPQENLQCSIKLAFPFLFGNTLKNHFVVNEWMNGWEIPQSNTNKTIVLFFLPQLLQWFGFLLIPLPFIVIFLRKK